MTPTELRLDPSKRQLTVSYEDGQSFGLSAEYLRVYSPSAEVQGHGPGQEVLQIGKEDVNIARLEPVGHYAINLVFDDNHDSGIYSWEYLYQLGAHYDKKWEMYLDRLKEAGYERKENKLES